MCRHKKCQLLQLFLLFCYLINGHQLGPVQVIENNLEQTEEVKAKNIEMAQQIVEIREKNVNGNIENELLEVCNLLKCPSANVDKFLIIQLKKLHPDKVGAENAKLGAEATIVINELRQFVKENTQKANQILTNERQLISESLKKFCYNAEILGKATLTDVRRMRKDLFDNDLPNKLDVIECFVKQNSEFQRNNNKNLFYQMKDELILHRTVFFNAQFEIHLKQIKAFGKNYEMRIHEIAKLLDEIREAKSQIEQQQISQFEFLTPNDIAKIFNQKIAAILEWKENARLAILEAEERHKLEEQLREIKMQIAELKRGGIIGSHSSSDLVNLAAQKMTNFKLFTLKKIPQSKLAKLNREHEQMAKKIEQHVDQEYLLIKAPKNNPSEVYKMWKQWESLAFTKDFYKQIEQKYN